MENLDDSLGVNFGNDINEFIPMDNEVNKINEIFFNNQIIISNFILDDYPFK